MFNLHLQFTFSYFCDFNYAEQVLEKMILKSRHSIGILDVHDSAKKKEFLDYRKAHIKDYEERYRGLPKLFYPKQFWIDFAEKHDLRLEIFPSNMKGYWNTPFVYHCFLYK